MDNSLTLLNTRLPESISQCATHAIESVAEGLTSPLELYISLSKLEKIAKAVKDDASFRESLLRQVELRGDLTGQRRSYTAPKECRIEIVETAVKYDFSECGDNVLLDLYKEQKEIEKRIKERETMLKTIKPRTTLIDDETGELLTLFPPSKSSITAPKVTFFNK